MLLGPEKGRSLEVEMRRRFHRWALLEVGVFVGIGRRAAAEKSEGRGGRDLVPLAGRNEDGITGVYRLDSAIDLHGTDSLEDEVQLF